MSDAPPPVIDFEQTLLLAREACLRKAAGIVAHYPAIDADRAHDVTNDVFSEMRRHHAAKPYRDRRGEPVASFVGAFATVFRWRCKDQVMRPSSAAAPSASDPSVELASQEAPPEDDGFHRAAFAQLKKALRDCLALLSLYRRQVVALTAEGHNAKVIGHRLGRGHGAIRDALSHAREQLRTCLADKGHPVG